MKTLAQAMDETEASWRRCPYCGGNERHQIVGWINEGGEKEYVSVRTIQCPPEELPR